MYMQDHYSPLGLCSIAGKSGDPFSGMAGGAVVPALLTSLAIFPLSSSACPLLVPQWVLPPVLGQLTDFPVLF